MPRCRIETRKTGRGCVQRRWRAANARRDNSSGVGEEEVVVVLVEEEEEEEEEASESSAEEREKTDGLMAAKRKIKSE